MLKKCIKYHWTLCRKNIENLKNKWLNKLLNCNNKNLSYEKRFFEAAQLGSKASFYYIGEMAEKGDFPGIGIDMKFAYENYLIAASYDSAYAYFKLA